MSQQLMNLSWLSFFVLLIWLGVLLNFASSGVAHAGGSMNNSIPDGSSELRRSTRLAAVSVGRHPTKPSLAADLIHNRNSGPTKRSIAKAKPGSQHLSLSFMKYDSVPSAMPGTSNARKVDAKIPRGRVAREAQKNQSEDQLDTSFPALEDEVITLLNSSHICPTFPYLARLFYILDNFLVKLPVDG